MQKLSRWHKSRVLISFAAMCLVFYAHTVRGENPSVDEVLAELTESLSKVTLKDRRIIQRALMNCASELTDVQRQPIEKRLKESERTKVDGLPPPPDYPAQLANYAQRKDVASRDERYAYFAREYHHYSSKAARDAAVTAMESISDPDLKLAVRWTLTAYSNESSFDDVKKAWMQIPDKHRSAQNMYGLANGLAPHLPARQQDILQFLDAANLQSHEKVHVIGQCVTKARQRMTKPQTAEMLLVAINELPKCDNASAWLHLILRELARVMPNETEVLIERYGKASTFDSKGHLDVNSKSWLRWGSCIHGPGRQRELLQLLRSDDELASRALMGTVSYGSPYPLYRDIADPDNAIEQAQFYADALIDIAESLDDKQVANQCRMILLSIDRPGLKIKGSQKFLESLDLGRVDCRRLLAALPRMDQGLQKNVLRKAFPTGKPLAQTRREAGRALVFPWQNSGFIASSLLAKSTIPLTEKRNYAQKLLEQCKPPKRRFYLAQRIAKFDACLALEIVWEVRNQLKGEMPHSFPGDCGGASTGYGANPPWPDETLGWVEAVFNVSWTLDAGRNYNGYSLPPRKTEIDESLIEGIDRFLKKETIAKTPHDRDALMVCRCCAEARLGNLGMAMVSARQLTNAKHQVMVFAHVLWLTTRPKLPQLPIAPM